jgi:hypothetical protein
MEIYIYLGLALFGFLTALLGPVLNILPKRYSWKGYGDPGSYFIISVLSFVLASDLVKQIHPQAEGSGHATPLLPDIAFVFLGLSVIGAAFGILRNTTVVRRWIIFPIVALGVIAGFVLNLSGEVDRKVVLAVYAVPQLLLFFAKDQENTTPASPEQGSSIVGTEASKL